MTRLMKRIVDLIASRKRYARRTDASFWQAMLAVHREYFENALIDYGQSGRPSQHIYHQLCTLDCWLDIAIEQGWIDDDQSSK